MQVFVIIFLLAYLTLLGGMYVKQRDLMYRPDQTIPKSGECSLSGMNEVKIAGYADVMLHALWCPPARDYPTLVYFHGNAGHVGDRFYKVVDLISKGYGVLLMSYRYNAKAFGDPSEKALISDGEAAIDWLQKNNIHSKDIFLYGESLGSGIAVALASSNNFKGLILEAPYSSVASVAQSSYWYLPVYWLVKDRFDSAERIDKVTAPILIVHGALDKTIPVRFGKKLHAAAGVKAEFVLLEQAGHADLYDHGMGLIVEDFINRLR